MTHGTEAHDGSIWIKMIKQRKTEPSAPEKKVGQP